MSQPHAPSHHPPNTPFEPPSPHIHHEGKTHAHFSRATFSGDMARTYNQRTGGCNITLADHLLDLIAPSLPPATEPLRILDNACGPLVLTTQCLLNPKITSHRSVHISAVDVSADFISAAQTLLSSSTSSSPFAHCNTPDGRIQIDTAIMDSTSLSHFPDSTFDLSLTALALFAFPSPATAASELHRTLKPTGVTAATTWKSVGWLPLLHEVEALLRPEEPRTEFPSLEAWREPGKLAGTLRAGGFERVEEREVEVVAWWGGVGEMAFWVAKTLGMMGGKGWGEGELEAGFRRVLETGGGEGEVVRGEGGRVGIRFVAFAGVGWK